MIYILVVVLVGLAAVAAFAFTMIWIVKSKYRVKRVPGEVTLKVTPESASKLAACARCNEQRLIISPDDGLCASCYSALRTKKTD